MLIRPTITPDALRFMCQEHEHLNSDAKSLLDRAAVEIENLRAALTEITDLACSEADDPLDDAINIAAKALA